MSGPFRFAIFFCFMMILSTSQAQVQNNSFVYVDLLPDAPELAKRGSYEIGVKTIDLLHKDQLDVLNFDPEQASLYDRPLRLEIWYPAVVNEESEKVTYTDYLGAANNEKRPLIPYTFLGRAVRDAPPLMEDQKYPLIIVSHGYLGSRFLLSYLTENLASKGYVVVAIDHTESTYQDANGFGSTLLNRSLDQLFVLNEIDRLSHKGSGSFLADLLDVNKTALVGY